jgi:hypothetical protein
MSEAPFEVPDEWRAAAEEIRGHLCLLRGGAPFLSPADTWQLVRWLEAGVPTGDVLRALERAAETRREKRGKTPLTLVAAKRHLGLPPKGRPLFGGPVDPREAPLSPLVRLLEARPLDAFEAAAAERLCAALLAIEARDEEGLRLAVAAIREFFEAAWSAAGEADRAAWRARAVEDLGDLLGMIDEGLRPSLVEEAARDHFRQRHPALTAAAVTELLGSV